MDDNKKRGNPQAVDADYLIDYKNGTMPLGDLPIGTKVVDLSWEWEFRTVKDYSGNGDVKPVTWIVVAKDHFSGLCQHTTLLAEELIGKHAFDNSTNRGFSDAKNGYNHWGDSGTANASRGLRPWLNSTGIHSEEGFFLAFSELFKRAVLTTDLPNKEWEKGRTYSTQDKVFISSSIELGSKPHRLYSQPVGSAYPFFQGAGDPKRVAKLGRRAWWYWTRSPLNCAGSGLRLVDNEGFFYSISDIAYEATGGVRPALNLKSGTLVSEIKK